MRARRGAHPRAPMRSARLARALQASARSRPARRLSRAGLLGRRGAQEAWAAAERWSLAAGAGGGTVELGIDLHFKR